ncbi:hypothetical protein DFQ28_011564 [Apophysomyces sp. BC1034]|nr:hypothetical protein DFQ30_011446 [Apophysomyces sp. BC1015]KAG0168881.1 hypothetical protein DFQ29_009978 [Apophysomyces sp. BC1021]KAG0184222.1 hypothetical protein DFQ28_011564 [Apophysomyces sp. BC1034]
MDDAADGDVKPRKVAVVLGCILLTWYTFMIGLSILGQWVGQKRYRRKPCPTSSKLPAEDAPGVSILRPLRGLDLELDENLRSSFEQQYPKFEVIFSVASADDPAITVVERLMKEYRDVDCRLIVGDRQVGSNPKVNNMVESYRTAKHDIIWILDSNVHVDRDTLGRSVDMLMQPGIGLVHHLPVAILPSTYSAEIEQTFLDTNHAKMYLAINAVGIASCVMGKSNLYRRSDLDRVGGLEAFANFMAEDNIVGEALWGLGLRHGMTADTACQVLGRLSPLEYCRRRARWVRLRKYIVTAATLTEPFTESIVCGVMGGLGAYILFGVSFWNFFGFHWLAWFINDYCLYRTLVASSSFRSRRVTQPMYSQQPVPFVRFCRAWFAREVLALPLYLYAMFGTEILWRDQSYRCLSDGTAVPLPKTTCLGDITAALLSEIECDKVH